MFWSSRLDETKSYRLSEHAAVAHSSDWLHLDSFNQCNMLHQCHKDPQHLEKQYCHEGSSMFWSFPLDQTRVRDYLSIPQ